MADSYFRQTALAPLGLATKATDAPGEARVLLSERPLADQVNLRGDGASVEFLQVARTTLGYALPTEPNTVAEGSNSRALWLGPNEWLLVAPLGTGLAGTLAQGLSGRSVAVTELGDARAVLGLSGRNARDVLAKSCPLDLHPKSFGPGRCAQTRLSKIGALLEQRDDPPSYEIYVARSVARYTWRWLEDAGSEYGVAVVAG
jgi:sarcosine oxidase, subunit gamma